MSLPAKLGTYFAAGRPVVAAVNRTDEVATEVTEAGAGLVIEPGRSEALLDALAALRRDDALRQEMGRNGAEHVRNHWSEASARVALLRFLARMGFHSQIEAVELAYEH
jgi:glycosyltransferase involved in cell wall biosynthesis